MKLISNNNYFNQLIQIKENYRINQLINRLLINNQHIKINNNINNQHIKKNNINNRLIKKNHINNSMIKKNYKIS